MRRFLLLPLAAAVVSCASGATRVNSGAPAAQRPAAKAPAASTGEAATGSASTSSASTSGAKTGGAQTTAGQAPAPGPQKPGDKPPAPGQGDEQGGGDGAGRQAAGRSGDPEIKAYDKVITKQAKSDPGLFTVHRIKDKVFYEIPKKELGKELLWVSQIARTTLGVGYGGQAAGYRVVRWERKGDRILLRSVEHDVTADPKMPIARAVQAANYESILMVFNIEALGKDDAPVIDVTRLFTTETPEFSVRARVRARTFDAARAFVERVVSFPENIEVEATHTFTSPPEPQAAGGGGQQSANAPRSGSASVLMHYSMVKLPEQPMMPRLFDERVGYFSIQQVDYGVDEHRAPRRRYITRWRLEKKNPGAALSEPVKPIVYWVDSATPEKWRPYVRRGVEQWQKAFEAAGFSNAILAKDAPSPEQDPEWSAEDARYSVIRWLPSTIENASGPHVHDPRTGEILESDIQFYHNVMNLTRSWYFLQSGPLDARAKTLPLPDDLMGTLIEYVVAHEVGHTLGFPHNMKASSMYPVEKLRDKQWLKEMGHTPTLMDYSRFNYVAQPEDGIEPAMLIPGIGPYDKWATKWGYAPIAGAKTPDEEKKTLDSWAREQDTTPWLRFSTHESNGADPGELTEAVGDADAVMATTMGLKNLKRAADMLMPATTASSQTGEPFDDLEELYGRMLGQWATELSHVAAIVGGFNSQQKHVGQSGVRFTPLSRERQAAAVKFLNEHAFATPAFAIQPEILRRIEPVGVLDRVRAAQQRVLNALLNPARLGRLVEQSALDGKSAYKPIEFLGDLRHGIWRELSAGESGGAVVIDAYRRNLQRAYVDTLRDRIRARDTAPGDARALFKGELRALDREIRAALVRKPERMTALHLEDVRDQIERALDPKMEATGAAPAAAPRPQPSDADGNAAGAAGDWFNDDTLHPSNVMDPFAADRGCWHDYAIRRDELTTRPSPR
jgi:hypothetical protein